MEERNKGIAKKLNQRLKLSMFSLMEMKEYTKTKIKR